MKINEAHLCRCSDQSTDPDRVVRSGYLYKKSETNRTFKKRWFLLKDNLLFYFHRKKSDPTVALGLIILEGCLVERIDDLSFQLTFPGSGARDYVFAAKEKEDVDEWMVAITCAGFDYMRYAIKELELLAEDLRQTRLQKQVEEPTPDDVTNWVGGRTEGQGDDSVKSAYSIARSSGTGLTRVEETMERIHCTNSVEERPQQQQQLQLPPSQNNSLRIFERMHLQFGNYIQAKQATAITSYSVGQ